MSFLSVRDAWEAVLNLSLRDELLMVNTHQDVAAFQRIFKEHPAADIAEAMMDLFESRKLSATHIVSLLRLLRYDQQAALFGYFSHQQQVTIAEHMQVQAIAELSAEMPHDERVDFLAHLSPELQEDVLANMSLQERQDIQRLRAYASTSVGAVMTSDFARLDANITVTAAMHVLKSIAAETETIYQTYVVDKQQRLLGTISLRELLVADDDAIVSDIMTKNVIFVHVDDAKTVATQVIVKYDLLAVPVVDANDQLVGIVTYDDAMDVAEAAADEGMHKTAAVNFSGNLKQASILFMYRKRVFWLVLLVFGNIFSGAGIAYFEDTIQAYVALVFFLPLLVDSGGNAGSQSATLMVRALATGEVVSRDWAKMLARELVIAGLLGLSMATAVSLLGFWRGGSEIALVVALTMQSVVVLGSVIGMSLPFILNKLKFDPAAASAPLITTIADSLGVVIYFSVATKVLGLPN